MFGRQKYYRAICGNCGSPLDESSIDIKTCLIPSLDSLIRGQSRVTVICSCGEQYEGRTMSEEEYARVQ